MVFRRNRKYNGNQYNGNQYSGNQYCGNQYNGNQYNGNQYNGKQYNGNQYNSNERRTHGYQRSYNSNYNSYNRRSSNSNGYYGNQYNSNQYYGNQNNSNQYYGNQYNSNQYGNSSYYNNNNKKYGNNYNNQKYYGNKQSKFKNNKKPVAKAVAKPTKQRFQKIYPKPPKCDTVMTGYDLNGGNIVECTGLEAKDQLQIGVFGSTEQARDGFITTIFGTAGKSGTSFKVQDGLTSLEILRLKCADYTAVDFVKEATKPLPYHNARNNMSRKDWENLDLVVIVLEMEFRQEVGTQGLYYGLDTSSWITRNSIRLVKDISQCQEVDLPINKLLGKSRIVAIPKFNTKSPRMQSLFQQSYQSCFQKIKVKAMEILYGELHDVRHRISIKNFGIVCEISDFRTNLQKDNCREMLNLKNQENWVETSNQIKATLQKDTSNNIANPTSFKNHGNLNQTNNQIKAALKQDTIKYIPASPGLVSGLNWNKRRLHLAGLDTDNRQIEKVPENSKFSYKDIDENSENSENSSIFANLKIVIDSGAESEVDFDVKTELDFDGQTDDEQDLIVKTQVKEEEESIFNVQTNDNPDLIVKTQVKEVSEPNFNVQTKYIPDLIVKTQVKEVVEPKFNVQTVDEYFTPYISNSVADLSGAEEEEEEISFQTNVKEDSPMDDFLDGRRDSISWEEKEFQPKNFTNLVIKKGIVAAISGEFQPNNVTNLVIKTGIVAAISGPERYTSAEPESEFEHLALDALQCDYTPDVLSPVNTESQIFSDISCISRFDFKQELLNMEYGIENNGAYNVQMEDLSVQLSTRCTVDQNEYPETISPIASLLPKGIKLMQPQKSNSVSDGSSGLKFNSNTPSLPASSTTEMNFDEVKVKLSDQELQMLKIQRDNTYEAYAKQVTPFPKAKDGKILPIADELHCFTANNKKRNSKKHRKHSYRKSLTNVFRKSNKKRSKTQTNLSKVYF